MKKNKKKPNLSYKNKNLVNKFPKSKLKLKRVTESDADFLFLLYNMSDKREKRPSITYNNNKKFVRDFAQKKSQHVFDAWYIIKYNGKSVGSVTLKKKTNECGYWLLLEYQNKRIGTWAFNELMKINPRPFYALVIHPYNKRSIHMAKKFGFKIDTYRYILTQNQ